MIQFICTAKTRYSIVGPTSTVPHPINQTMPCPRNVGYDDDWRARSPPPWTIVMDSDAESPIPPKLPPIVEAAGETGWTSARRPARMNSAALQSSQVPDPFIKLSCSQMWRLVINGAVVVKDALDGRAPGDGCWCCKSPWCWGLL